jgi:hypothetical protein
MTSFDHRGTLIISHRITKPSCPDQGKTIEQVRRSNWLNFEISSVLLRDFAAINLENARLGEDTP